MTTEIAPEWTAYHTPESVRREFRDFSASLERGPLLDKPSEPHPILNALLNEALCRILLTSDGAVMALKVRVTGGRAESSEPSSDLAAMIDKLDARYGQCKTHRKRLAIIKEAQTTANLLRWSPDRSVVRGTREWREAIAGDPRSCRVLADVHDTSHMTIARIKRDARSVTRLAKRTPVT